jgi:aminoglycoside phosphotransferase (APT) family kinase protein
LITNTVSAEDLAGVIDLQRLRQWMDSAGLGEGELADVRLLKGGTQNLLLHFSRAGRGFVLRRPPRHLRPGSDSAMLREARMLRALAGSTVPHPRFIAECEDKAVLGAAFFLMQPVAGFNASFAGLPPLHASDPAIRNRMGMAMVDAIAALGQLDPAALGLADLGRPGGFLQRQVQRWKQQLHSYADLPGWPGLAALPDVDPIAAWLDQTRPDDGRPSLIHGDFHLANVLFRHDSGELAAVVDWEMCTVGDPLLDLGWLLATWPRPDGTHHLSHRISPWAGFPAADALVERYRQQSSRDVGHARWYAVLACYKLAIVLEGTHARACAGLASMETGQRLHQAARGLLLRAIEWIEQ